MTLNNKDAFGKTFNLTYGESRTLDELANIVVDIDGQ